MWQQTNSNENTSAHCWQYQSLLSRSLLFLDKVQCRFTHESLVEQGCGTGGVRIWPSSQLLCVPAGCLCPLKLVFFPGTLTVTLSRNVRIQSSAHLPLIPQEIVVTEKTKHVWRDWNQSLATDYIFNNVENIHHHIMMISSSVRRYQQYLCELSLTERYLCDLGGRGDEFNHTATQHIETFWKCTLTFFQS